MALPAENISASVDMNNDQIKELQNVELTRRQLERRLFVQEESFKPYEVDKPRTVCAHSPCVDILSDLPGREKAIIIYKTMCHRSCYLNGVDRNAKGHPQLQKCWAMTSGSKCHQWDHTWTDHMHIYYEYSPATSKHRDETVNQDLVKNASDNEMRKEAIRMKETAIEEFKLEHQQVKEASIQFSFSLKRHAITPYNDVTVEYLDMQIDQEKLKVQNGGTKKRLLNLKKHKTKHIQKVEILKKAMVDGGSTDLLDDAGLGQLVLRPAAF